jgi:hypothetical protein
MRTQLPFIISALILGSLHGGQTPQVQQKNEESIQNLDYEIKLVDQQIEHYTSLANQFDRQSQELLSHDFEGSRNAATLSSINKSIATDLIQRRQELKEHRDQLLHQKNTNVTR